MNWRARIGRLDGACRRGLRRGVWSGLWLFASAATTGATSGAAGNDVEERVRRDIALLSSLGSRVVGYPGHAAAADFVERRFREVGLVDVRRDTFEVVVPVDHGASLHLLETAQRLPLHGLWPNLVRTPTLPKEGVAAPMFYAGSGTYPELDGQRLEGRVALLEFNSQLNWLDLAALGVRAIIFIEPQHTTNYEAQRKFSLAPLDVPRFWIDRAAGDALRRRLRDGTQVPVELYGRMDWERRPAWNIEASVPGQGATDTTGAVYLHAYYDGSSVVPGLDPGAGTASSIAALLEAARYLVAAPPGRPVRLVALGAHFQARQGMARFLDRRRQADDGHAELCIGLDLSSGTDELGFWNNSYEYRLKRPYVPYGRLLATHGQAVAAALGRDPERAFVNGISPLHGRDWVSYVPQQLTADGELALLARIPSLTLATVHDLRDRTFTPLDTFDPVGAANVARQARLLREVLRRLLDDPALDEGAGDLVKALRDVFARARVRARTFPRRSQIPDEPVVDALVLLTEFDKQRVGVVGHRYGLTGTDGDVLFPGLARGRWPLAAFVLDPFDGRIRLAPDLSTRAQAHHGKADARGNLTLDLRLASQERTVVLFPTVARDLHTLIEPRRLGVLAGLRLLDGGGAEPREFGYLMGGFEEEPAGVIFGSLGGALRDRTRFLLGGASGLLLLNATGHATEAEARGRGFLLREEGPGETAWTAARDMWHLDEFRLRRLRAHGIGSPWLERLHAQVEGLLEAADAARARLDWETLVARSREAAGLEALAYREIRAQLNDVIKGLAFVLALLIPAVFFAERLLVAAADIRRQLAAVAALTVAVWLVMSWIHPAFELAQPMVVFLGFAIMAISVFVLVMISSRFSRAARDFRSRVAAVHVADISRFGAAYAAFTLGISNMRRRRLRTALTLTTLTLLTFSVMSFTSFQRQTRFVTMPVRVDDARGGLLIRDASWGSLGITALEYAQAHFGRVATVVGRSWFSEAGGGDEVEVRHAARATHALGIVGLMPGEAEVSPVSALLTAGDYFATEDERSCLLSETVAGELGIVAAQVGRDTVRVLGIDLRVRGLFEGSRLDGLLDLDGGSLTPIDERLSTLPPGAELLDEEQLLELERSRNFVHIPGDRVVVLPYRTHRAAGGVLHSVAVGFQPGVDEIGYLESYLQRVAATIYASLPGGGGDGRRVVRYTSFGVTGVEGLSQLAIPALIAALIVLNTMLGAVYERWREIGIYSSVGLSPLHIAVLFLAEACVYAILGVTLGYLLGQGLGRILLASGSLHGVSLNYSSVAAMTSSAGVMAIVLLSTIYPARVAAAMAVPEVTPRWRPPPPEGDRWDLPFPFNVSDADVVGVCGFLCSYFESHAGAISGSSYTEGLRLRRVGDREAATYELTFRLWLAPYDLGVSQDVGLTLQPAPGARGMYEVHVTIARVSGEQFHWQRLNRPFFRRLRKQLLIWNALSQQARRDHRRNGRDQLARATGAPTDLGATTAAAVAGLPADAVSEAADVPSRSPFSLTGLAVGAVMSFAVGAGATYGAFYLQGSRMSLNSTTPIALFYFFFLVGLVHLGVAAARRRFDLPAADLVLIYIMMTLAAAVPNQAFVGTLLPVIAGYFYYATPANGWVELFGADLPGWLLPDAEAAALMHEGLAEGAAIPWAAWLEPLGYWYAFFLALGLMMICLNTILHRQWSVHERLEYPMVQLPLAMIGRDEGTRGGLPALLRQRRFWIGLLIPVVLLSLRGLRYYVPGVPVLTLSWGNLELMDNMPLRLSTNYAWIGISYLVSLDISMSIWVFYILGRFQDALFTNLGVAPTEQLSFYASGTTADLAHQATGACFVFVLWGLWMARRHLRDVWRSFLGRGRLDDSEELMSYRAAVLGLLGSLLFVGGWLWASGIPLLVLPAFLGTCILFYILVTRVVSTAGVATARAPMISAFVLISGLGSSLIGTKGLVALTLTYIWHGEMRLFPMIVTANALKLAESVRGPKGRLFWGMLIALALSLAGATWMVLDLSHTHGGINLDGFLMKHQAERIFNDMARHIREPRGPDWRGWGFTGLGATIEGLLIAAQYRFAWWPLHPVGFIISNGWLTGQIWLAVFFGWAAKSLIMKFGGMSLYLRMKPLFLGLILGEAVVAGIWLVIDHFLGGTGHRITVM